MPAGYPELPSRTLGEKIRKRRMDLGLSQRKLAKQLGVDSKTVWNWELGRSLPLRWMVPGVREFLRMDPIGPPPDSLGARLTAYRRSRGMSQAQMARLLGVHKTTVVRWETGRRRPSRAAEQTLARKLQLIP